MKKKLFVLILTLVVALLFAIPVSAETQNGWVEESYGWFYYENGEPLSNCIKEIDGEYYAFNYGGSRYNEEGLFSIHVQNGGKNEWCIFYVTADNGKLLTNAWKETKYGYEEDLHYFYFGDNAIAYKDGIYEIDGEYYAFNYDGSRYDEEGLYEFNIKINENESKTQYCYVTADNGKLLTNAWKKTNHGYEEDLYYFYLGDDAFAYCGGLHEIDGDMYYFDSSGRMITDFVYTEDEKIYYAGEDGKIRTSQWFYTSIYEYLEPGWFYASADGTLYKGGVHQVGDYYYYFDDNGEMQTGFIRDYYAGKTYYADPNNDSRLKINTWFQATMYDGWDELFWFYATNDGSLYSNTVVNIGGTLYGFYESCQMADGTTFELSYYDEELEEHVIEGYYRAKEGGALYVNQWYEERYNGWYYYTADGKAALGLVNIGGVTYFFEDFEYGRMLEDNYAYYYDGDTTRFLVADENGAVTEVYSNNWTKIGDYWYFVQGESFCVDGMYEIDGKKYGFNYRGHMYENRPFYINVYDENTGEYLYEEYYFAKADGTVAENEWCLETSEYGDSWWYYAGSDGKLYNQGLYEVGGKEYWFDMDGTLIADTIYYDGEEQLYICPLNEDGSGGYVIRTEGWYTCEGEWIYVNAEGQVYEGWLNDQYYLDPDMYFGAYILMPEFISEEEFYVELYLFNKNGTSEKITADGFYSAKAPHSYDSSYTVYVRDGKVVINDWVYTNGHWYYFDEQCRMVANESYTVKGIPYFFDSNGIMADNGWVRSSEGVWYYAYPDGALFTGIDASNYLFDETGALIVNDFCAMPDGTIYYADENGIIIHTAINGWNEIRGDRYYIEDGEMLRDRTRLIGDVLYGFDGQGKMVKNTVFYGYLFGANGKQVQNAWLQIDGKWYYATEHNACYSGIYEINGKKYYFENSVLQQNTTSFSHDEHAIITTDSEGIVLSTTPANGWTYSTTGSDYAHGEVYYFRNGEPVTDWIGPYYVEDGYMIIDSVVEWKDAHYYLDKKGVYVSCGWYERYEDRWIYARNDGSLYYDEWLLYNGSWYYFDGSSMFADGILYIDGAFHSFDENGVWLGESNLDLTNLPDGWFYYQNAWYYINATVPVSDCELYIDGAWYAFSYDGTMVENRLYGNYYYLDGGKRAENIGWAYLKTGWSYFNQDHSVAYGWLKDGNQYYFLDYKYAFDEPADKYYMSYATVENDYRVIDGKLYYFNASGALQYEVTNNGWYEANGEWYCIWDGKVCYDGIYNITGTYYAFDSEGRMLNTDIYDGKFFDMSGAMITESGWYYIDTRYIDGWIYILEDGRVATSGIFLIDGKEYCFSDYLWVE